jgi:hypothetical protein
MAVPIPVLILEILAAESERNRSEPDLSTTLSASGKQELLLYVKTTSKTLADLERRPYLLPYLTAFALTFNYDVIDFIRLHVCSYSDGQLGARLKHAVSTS